MLIALLVALGVDLVVIVALAVIMLGRRRWLERQPGEFAGAIRVTSGDVPGLSSKWTRGSGRWVRDVLAWNHGTFRFRTSHIAVDHISGERSAGAGELKRLGDAPIVVDLCAGDAAIEVAARAESRARVAGLFVPRAGALQEPGAGIESATS